MSVPLAQLNPAGKRVGEVQLKNAAGGTLATVYIDEVRLVR